MMVRGLGKEEELSALSNATPEYMQGLLRAVVPEMPDAHRFVLIKGLEAYAGNTRALSSLRK